MTTSSDSIAIDPLNQSAAPVELRGVTTTSRYFAMVIDNLLACLVAVLVAFKAPLVPAGLRIWGAPCIYLLYFFVQEGASSTTLGKRLFGLRVRHLDGSACSWSGAAIRTATRIVDVNPLLLGALPGAIIAAVSRRRQRLGDLLAGTVVTE